MGNKLPISLQSPMNTASSGRSAPTELTWVSDSVKQRKKRFSSKVRTGCETCKKRRVKCDEGKPACANCNRSGRRCEGYQSANPGIYWFEHDGIGKKAAPSVVVIPPLTKHVDLKYGKEGDKALLDLFLGRTASQIVRYSNPYFWYTLVPQASWSHEGIRHCVAAVGLACQEHDSPETRVLSRHTRSIHHYNAAIRTLTSSSRDGKPTPPDVMLICCVLFWLFENLKNRPCIAMTHLKAAVEMLNERPRLSTSREDLISMHIEPVLQEGMVFAATVLPTGGRNRHEAPATMAAFIAALDNLRPSESPKDLHACRYDFGRCQEALVIATKMQMSTSSPDPDISLVRQLYSDWNAALEKNAHKWPEDYVRMLRMHYTSQVAAIDIVESSMLGTNIRAKPEWRLRTQWILEEARYFAALKQKEVGNDNPPLIDVSLITLLAIQARQCPPRDADLAEEAIDLLQEFEWFEGIWNSRVAAELIRLMRTIDAEHNLCRRGDLETVFERAAGIKEHVPTGRKRDSTLPAVPGLSEVTSQT